METRILPPAPEGSRLAEWAEAGTRHEPGHSNLVTYISPDEEYALTVELDDPVRGFLIRLFTPATDRDDVIGQAVVDERDLAIRVASSMAAAADDLAALEERPALGLETVHREDVERGDTEPPEEWAETDPEEWNDRLEEAYDKAEIPRSKGSLTVKEIDGRQYYYLQWREGDTVTSQYVAPVTPKE